MSNRAMVMKIVFSAFFLVTAACQEKTEPIGQADQKVDAIIHPEWKSHRWSGYEVIDEMPHDPEAFTQGLIVSGGDWIESTGGYGTSSVRRVDRKTGKVKLKKELGEDFFGEGVVELGGKLFQLTWENRKGFVYDLESLELLGDFRYNGEGWGLTTDGESLIMSDGSSRLRYLEPDTFRMRREVTVNVNGKPVEMLNELEFVEGEIFANVWHTDQILRIDPADGKVVGVIDLTGIDEKEKRTDPEHVLNGIAYDPESGAIFVTGKCWPKIYRIRLVRKR